MKRINLIFVMALLLVGCEKDIYETLEFGVKLSNDNSYIEGEEVTFYFSGNADYVLFYTGEEGSRYENEDGTTGKPLDIKSLADDLDSYSYTYASAGEYRVTFVATAANVYGSSREIKSFDITITEKAIEPQPDPDPDSTAGGTLGDLTGSNDDIFADSDSSSQGSLGDLTGSNDDIFPDVKVEPTTDSSLDDLTGSNSDIFAK